MAVPTFQAAGTALDSGASAVTVAWPTHAAGDIGLLLCESANQAVTLSTANGFDSVTQVGIGTAGGTNATLLAVYWCRATSSAMASPVVNMPGDHIFAVIITFRGCLSSGPPWDSYATSTKSTSSTTSTFPTAPVTQPGGRVVLMAACGRDAFGGAGYTVPTNSGLTGITEHLDVSTFTAGGGTLEAASGTYVGTTGFTGTSTATITEDALGDLVEVNMTMVLKNNPPPVNSHSIGQSIPRSSLR